MATLYIPTFYFLLNIPGELIISHTSMTKMSFQIIVIKFPTQVFISTLDLIKEVRELEMRIKSS